MSHQGQSPTIHCKTRLGPFSSRSWSGECIHCGFFNGFARSLHRAIYVGSLMYFLVRFLLKFPCICLASLWISCAFRRRLLVYPRGSRLGFLQRSKSCLFPGRLIFYFVIEVAEYFKGSSSKSSKYLTKGLAERFTRLRCRRSEHRKISLEGVEAHRLSPLPAHLQANYPCACVEGSEQKKE